MFQQRESSVFSQCLSLSLRISRFRTYILQSVRWTLAGQSQLPESVLKRRPAGQERRTPPVALVHWMKSWQLSVTPTVCPAAVHLPGSGLGWGWVGSGLGLPPVGLGGSGPAVGGSTGT